MAWKRVRKLLTLLGLLRLLAFLHLHHSLPQLLKLVEGVSRTRVPLPPRLLACRGGQAEYRQQRELREDGEKGVRGKEIGRRCRRW